MFNEKHGEFTIVKNQMSMRHIYEMTRMLKMKCPYCCPWNRIPVNKIFLEQPTSEPNVKAHIPMYEPFKTNLKKLKSLLCPSVNYES